MLKVTGTRRAGFTLVEITVALGVLASVIGGVFAMLQTSSRAFQVASSGRRIENMVMETLDEIADKLRASKLSTITPQQAPPFSSSSVDFQRTVGYAGGATVWSTTERIRLQNGQVQWTQNLGLPNESTTVWADSVPAYLQGETANGADDNANGLIDEGGLCFTFTGSSVLVRLTMRTKTSSGTTLTHTGQERIFFRNR
jgi:type II secretory pathway pseudopilin PulG